jgi:hypothetical protein
MSTRDDDIRQNDSGGYSTSNSQRIADGMTVYDVNGEKIGTVSGYTTSGAYFKLEKGLIFHHDYYVPMSAVSRLDPDGVYLNVLKDDIKDRGWDNPPLGGDQRNESLGDRVRDTLDPNDEPRL